MGQRGRYARVTVAGGRKSALRALEITATKVHETETETRLLVRRIESERHLPLIGRALELSAIRVDTREHVVRIRDVRMAIEPTQRDTHREIELTCTPQRVGERHEHEARRITGEIIAETPNLVSHRPPP